MEFNCEITLVDLITALVAVAGLGLSVTALVLRRLDKNPVLKTSIQFGFMKTGDNMSDLMIWITVSNPGEKNVRLSSIALDIKGVKNKIALLDIQGEVQLPHLVEVGHSFNFWRPLDNIIEVLKQNGHNGKVKLNAMANDGFGNSHKSKKSVEVDLNEEQK